MSLSSKFVFGTCCLASISTIAYVHLKQHFDRWESNSKICSAASKIKLNYRLQLKEGVVKDIERQRVQQEMKKTINTYNLQQQKDLEKILRRDEPEMYANETWNF